FQKNTNRSDFNFFQANLAKNNDWVPSSMYGASVKLPIFAGGLTRSKIKEIDIKLKKTKNEMDNFDRFAILDYTNAKQSYGLAIKIVVNQKENVALAQRIFDKSTIKYKEGVGSTLEVIQAQTDLQSAFNNYMNALNDLVLAKIDYRNACGKTLE
ncbi:MAG: TolC family protein, partial [Bacteroidetes bacterium]|nr:TolC family protein [Bacteroidota bacterium]